MCLIIHMYQATMKIPNNRPPFIILQESFKDKGILVITPKLSINMNSVLCNQECCVGHAQIYHCHAYDDPLWEITNEPCHDISGLHLNIYLT